LSEKTTNLLEVRDVTKEFGSLVAVSNVSLAVPAGELHAVIGPNGAGKTTFFNMISGLFAPTRGSIVFDGADVTSLPAYKRVQGGMVRTFQITEIFPELTVRENVRIAVEVAAGYRLRPWLSRVDTAARDRDVQNLIEQTGLADNSERLVGELSHGDQRATEIATALALKPLLLLLDEPTAGMGEQETTQITSLVRKLHRESRYTIVLIEHDMRVVFHLADRLTVLDQGKLLAQGTPKEVASNEAVQAAYLGKAE
jgi:branched-chain amino acid transport system ATP-binding protein